MTVDYKGLAARIAADGKPFGLLSMQSAGSAAFLAAKFPKLLKALYSAEHGFFGMAGAGERTESAWHPFWNVPIHSLYGEHRKPTGEMLEGVGRMVVDLCDIGVRCYTYLATLKNMLEACAAKSIPVTVLDRPIPLGSVVDGPMLKPSYESFVAPLNVPFCHGMTPGECAVWIAREEKLDLDLDVVRLVGWSHADFSPWPNFVPPSPAIRSWDSAVAYPLTVFTEAYRAVDCDRQGSMAFRVIGAPWLDTERLVRDLAPGLETCGFGMRPYRYVPSGGEYRGLPLNGILFSVNRGGDGCYPVTAGVLVLTALIQRHHDKMAVNARPEWLDKLFGSTELRDTLRCGSLDDLFTGWIEAQEKYLATKVDLYRQEAGGKVGRNI